VNIQGTFREHAGNVQKTFREYSGNIQGILRAYSANIHSGIRRCEAAGVDNAGVGHPHHELVPEFS
jgi:DNA anti-recombination protein RmuC